MNARNIKDIVLRAHPALAKAAGRVKAPVPTIKLKTYIKPTHIEYWSPVSVKGILNSLLRPQKRRGIIFCFHTTLLPDI